MLFSGVKERDIEGNSSVQLLRERRDTRDRCAPEQQRDCLFIANSERDDVPDHAGMEGPDGACVAPRSTVQNGGCGVGF